MGRLPFWGGRTCADRVARPVDADSGSPGHGTDKVNPCQEGVHRQALTGDGSTMSPSHHPVSGSKSSHACVSTVARPPVAETGFLRNR